ncbi:hypothetical protein C6569_09020 [Phreatobacter cathodiphilus]|uniref:Uncharacterized protein n=1 Tax=Phreatobacter cathodiphilus TaxID=1868589 RepID=A0A2S0NB85_9HYPH|nr:hypothetical protein C6569_09020 [Phreatobacter cathodiphilus]
MAAAASPRVGREDVAAYVARLAAEMVELARVADLHLLAYLADMTRLEAEQQVRLLRRTPQIGPAPQARDTRPPESR